MSSSNRVLRRVRRLSKAMRASTSVRTSAMRSLTRCLAASMRSAFPALAASMRRWFLLEHRTGVFRRVPWSQPGALCVRWQPPAAVWQSRRVRLPGVLRRHCGRRQVCRRLLPGRLPVFGCFFTGQGAALNGFLTQQLDLGLELFDIGFELRHSFQRMTQSQGCLDGFVSIGGEKNADDEIADEQDNRRNRKHSAGDRIMDDIGHKDG